MNKRTTILAVIVAGGGLAAPASAQEDCHCDCYFSGDCVSGQFCDWDSIPSEDNCWWRQPKPQGVVGGGCGDHFGDWGQCDGICSGTLMPVPELQAADKGKVRLGIAAWAQALTELSLSGGGTPTEEMIAEIDAIGFGSERMTYRLWRITLEAFTLSRGMDYVIYPQGHYGMTSIAVADLSDRPDQVRNGNLAIQGLLAEIDIVGAGAAYIERVDEKALDEVLFERICEGNPDRSQCLYTRIFDLGTHLSQAGSGGAPAPGGSDGGLPNCPGCPGDCSFNDVIDFEDLLGTLSNWSSTTWACGDLDGSGVIGFPDLLQLMAHWGPCAP